MYSCGFILSDFTHMHQDYFSGFETIWFFQWQWTNSGQINGLMQKRHNSIANALELGLFCIAQVKYGKKMIRIL